MRSDMHADQAITCETGYDSQASKYGARISAYEQNDIIADAK